MNTFKFHIDPQHCSAVNHISSGYFYQTAVYSECSVNIVSGFCNVYIVFIVQMSWDSGKWVSLLGINKAVLFNVL